MLLISALGVSTVAWLASRYLFGSSTPTPPPTTTPMAKQQEDAPNFVQIMKQQNRKVAIFYGSQTGTAEDYAKRLGKECKKRFNVSALVMDIETCDMSVLDQFPEDGVAIFVMATYGEGEPTDSAQAFWDLLEEPKFSQEDDSEQPLSNLRYLMFGLGNSSYAYFNWVGKLVDEKLTGLGATLIGERGAGDDDKSLEDDFEAWQEAHWPLLGEMIDGGDASSESSGPDTSYTVQELTDECNDKHVYLGELGEKDQATWDARKPYPAPLAVSQDLMTDSDRHCLHLEVDMAGSGMTYETGDHIAIWPSNNQVEIMRLARILGLHNKLETVISVKAVDDMAVKKAPFPQPTTYHAMLRHYLDICQLPSRQVLQMLVPFCQSPDVAAQLQTLVNDKDEHRKIVLESVRNLAQVLEYVIDKAGVDSVENVFKVPSEVVIECFGRLQPRYYSISSSSSENPDRVSVTAVTLKYQPDPTPERTVFGVNTNYLWAVHAALQQGDKLQEDDVPQYAIEGPNGQYFDHANRVAKLPVHIRRSTFKLPSDTTKPIIMVGPGTGVAPFRGFVHERVYQRMHNKQVGPTILYFGCRRSSEDFLYKNEWPGLFDKLSDDNQSRIITAFSRESDKKVYVQDRLKENGDEMWDLIHNKGAYIYICGDAKRMAKDVQQTITGFAKQFGGYEDDQAISYVSQLREDGRYQEDVWA
ncbi:riboflavin synthase domain-like protein [Lichtheimia hyalospora FSU 10163]|nr:riboflavin synthase domain-like protein [Lichtheimia hyalospora FSU 10163]